MSVKVSHSFTIFPSRLATTPTTEPTSPSKAAPTRRTPQTGFLSPDGSSDLSFISLSPHLNRPLSISQAVRVHVVMWILLLILKYRTNLLKRYSTEDLESNFFMSGAKWLCFMLW
ncbi:hypothetical protein ACFX2J_017277 [Malus domestica]